MLARYPQAREPQLHKLIIRDIIDAQVQDVVATTAHTIANTGVENTEDVRKQPEPLVRYSAYIWARSLAACYAPLCPLPVPTSPPSKKVKFGLRLKCTPAGGQV